MVVGGGQVKIDPVKVKGIANWPTPTLVKEIRAFLGFGNFYKDFIDHYSLIVQPLHDLTKKSRKSNGPHISNTGIPSPLNTDLKILDNVVR